MSNPLHQYQAEERARKARNRDAQRRYRRALKDRVNENSLLQSRVVFLETLLRNSGIEIPTEGPITPRSESESLGCSREAVLHSSSSKYHDKYLVSPPPSRGKYAEEAYLSTPASVAPVCDVDFDPFELSSLVLDIPNNATSCSESNEQNAVTKSVAQAQTPLALAASTGNIQLIDILIGSGADISIRDGSGSTALHWAYAAGNRKAAEILHQRGAADIVDQLDYSGRTVLAIAIQNGRPDLARLAIENGANVNFGSPCKSNIQL